MIRCIVIDDEPLALRQIESYIRRVPFLECVSSFDNALDALSYLSSQTVDLIYVDINMPDLNGIEFVRSLRERYMIVFTTAYSEYAIESYKLDAVDYLLKPIGFSDFMRSAGKALQLHEWFEAQNQRAEASAMPPEPEGEEAGGDGGNETISVKADHRVVLVRTADITYLESEGEYVRIHLLSGEIVTTLVRLKNIETILPADSFMRVHRSYIVGLKHIRELGKGRIFFADKSCVPVGENYREAFNRYIEKTYHNL